MTSTLPRLRRTAGRLALLVTSLTGLGLAPTAQASMSATTARFVALGYLWGDGHAIGGGWSLIECAQPSVDRFAAASEVLSGSVERFRPKGGCEPDHHQRYGVRAHATGLTSGDVNQPGMPESLKSAGATSTKEFLSGVVEGEGNARTGLVLDDPIKARVDAMITLLDRVSVRTFLDANPQHTYFRLYAVKDD